MELFVLPVHVLVFVSGVFVLLYAYAYLRYMQTFLSKAEFRYFFIFAVAIAAGVVFLVVVALTWAGG